MSIHDKARKLELSLAKLDDAFIPLERAAENEGLFDYTLYVACLGDRVVGFIAYSAEEIAWLYVDPDIHRQGVGKQHTLFAMKQSANANEISIEVLHGNVPALRLYQSCGFENRETVSGRMPGNETFAVTADVLAYRNEVINKVNA